MTAPSMKNKKDNKAKAAKKEKKERKRERENKKGRTTTYHPILNGQYGAVQYSLSLVWSVVRWVALVRARAFL